MEADLDALRELVEGERYGYRTEKRYIHAGGHPVWISLNVSPIYEATGAPSYLIAQIEDISDRKESEERLTRQALHDSLTGLPNRTLFSDCARMASARRGARGFAIIYLDLDGFKLVNDTLGHAAGRSGPDRGRTAARAAAAGWRHPRPPGGRRVRAALRGGDR